MKKFTLILAALITSTVMVGCTPFGCKSHEKRGHRKHHPKQERMFRGDRHMRGNESRGGRFRDFRSTKRLQGAPKNARNESTELGKDFREEIMKRLRDSSKKRTAK